MQIRSVRLNDAVDIARLSSQLGYPVDAEGVEEFLAQIELDSDHSVFLAEHDAGSVLGWIHVFMTKRLFVAPFAEIGGLVVDKNSRGQGVGHQLLDEAEKWAQLKGCSAMVIRSNVIRNRAHEFYVGTGYSVMKRQAVFHKAI
jgi:GNAT superfamily N-acetyltransferase